jgi:hypothetical protein
MAAKILSTLKLPLRGVEIFISHQAASTSKVIPSISLFISFAFKFALEEFQ